MIKKLKLPSGELILPVFFPDGTNGAVRCTDSDDLKVCGVEGVVMNTYHLLGSPGISTVRSLGGLHEFAGWDRPILTDSGGFQVFSLIHENPKFGTIRKNEIVFHPENGRGKTILTPEKCIQAQFAFGSDIMMCLDFCTRPDDSEEINRESVEMTVQWAKRCKEEFIRQCESRRLGEGERPLLFGIIQGGGFTALRDECAERLERIGFDGYGFGGWPLDREGNVRYDVLEYTASLMPNSKPKYAMGIGKPEVIARCCKMGYEIFDCVIPSREARHNRLYTCDMPFGEVDRESLCDSGFYSYHYILDDKYIKDSRPVSEVCDCHLCRNYSRAYLRHLYKSGDSLAYRLATIHNLRFYTQLMERLRDEE